MSSKKKSSVVADVPSLIALRNSLGWTQEQTAQRTGYSERLIRKLELGNSVRASTIVDVLTCYHKALGKTNWNFDDFVSNDDADAGEQSKNEACIQLIRDYFEIVFNCRQPDRIVDFISEDVQLTAEGLTRRGRDAIEQRARTLLDAFSPIHHQIEDAICESFVVTCHWKARMKQVGDFFEIPATGLWVETRGVSKAKFRDDLIIEVQDQWDVEHVFRQLRGEGPRII